MPASVEMLVRSFVDAACDGAAGLALHALHALDARVYRAGAWCPLGDEAAYATAHQLAHERGNGALPLFLEATALSWRPEKNAAVGVAWFVARESHSGHDVVGAIGIQTGGELRIAWATLAEQPCAWSFSDGLARMLGTFAWMDLREPAAARTALDASWFRMHWLPNTPLTALPGTRFSCRGSTTCCRQEYTVALPAAAQLLVDALPWERLAPHLLGTRLQPFGDGLVELKGKHEACRFLGSRNECVIHAELGYQPFAPCAAFPFSFTLTPEGVDVTASLTCDSVCEGSGAPLGERDKDLRQRLAIAPLRSTATYRLAPDKAVDWNVFRDAETLLRQILGLADIPLQRRLYLGLRALEALVIGDDLRLEEWLSSSPPELDPALHEQIGEFLDRIMQWDRVAFSGLLRSVPRDLRHRDLRGESRLAATLISMHFSKVYSYEFDLVTANNLGILAYLLALSWERNFPGGLDELRWKDLAMLCSHGLLGSLLGPDSSPGNRALLGTPQFGEWVLAYAQA